MPRIRCLTAAALAAAALAAAAAVPALAITGPFAWQTINWCPSHLAKADLSACNTVQTVSGLTAAFDPAQVSIDGSGFVDLAVSADLSKTGAINTEGSESWAPSTGHTVTISVKAKTNCNATHQIYNQPALWMNAEGTWPSGMEFDLMEGLKGTPAWHVHYLDASGAAQSVGGNITNINACGTFTYKIVWSTTTVTFYAAGTQVGQVAQSCTSPCISLGVPISTAAHYFVAQYGSGGTNSGPTHSDTMPVETFTETTS